MFGHNAKTKGDVSDSSDSDSSDESGSVLRQWQGFVALGAVFGGFGVFTGASAPAALSGPQLVPKRPLLPTTE